MIKFTSETLRDKVYGCWVGKNIGGTLGTPFEGRREIIEIEGYSTPKGVVLPNDDLDLQLVWLKALEDRGPLGVNAQLLGEYWINYIGPHWNEYGIGKCNMKAGLLPPMSGEYCNEEWKHSNGAWIRSEVWACLNPGNPDAAIKYAYEDACVDHGMGEGTYAELFTAALQSAAFVCTDIFELINIGLSKIPSDCRVTKSVNLALNAYKQGLSWKEARQIVLDDSLVDLGWFQAPANVAYTIIGLLYGEGDFKKSMLIAIGCGDDTDCTGATLGALFGIMYGEKALPADWKEYIGDNIITVAVERGSIGYFLPKTCSELTDRIIALLPSMIKANNLNVDVNAQQDEYIVNDTTGFKNYPTQLLSRSPYSIVSEFIYAKVLVDYGKAPVIKPNEEFTLTLTFSNLMPDPKHLHIKWHLPEGFAVRGPKDIYLYHQSCNRRDTETTYEYTIIAGDKVDTLNRAILEVSAIGRPTVGLVSVVFLG